MLMLAGGMHLYQQRALQHANQRFGDLVAVQGAVSVASVSIAFDATPGGVPHTRALAAFDGVRQQLGRLLATAPDESAESVAIARYVRDAERLHRALAQPGKRPVLAESGAL
ncbi:MAG: hypothetical protein V4750_16295, partial [Pseudomonadota bacterium]